jgi:hypothetical protein
MEAARPGRCGCPPTSVAGPSYPLPGGCRPRPLPSAGPCHPTRDAGGWLIVSDATVGVRPLGWCFSSRTAEVRARRSGRRRSRARRLRQPWGR